MPGQGVVVYFVNPHVAWNGSLEIRKVAAKETAVPTLQVVSPSG
jgi:hypothetical protein